MPTSSIGLGPQELSLAFPFHVAFDGECRIVQVGSVIQRLLPDIRPGTYFRDHFRIERPGVEPTFDTIRAHSHVFFLLESRATKALVLRGQMLTLEGRRAMVFLGSPWLTEVAELKNLGLSIRDFALHDPISDFLFLLQAQNASLADAGMLANELGAINKELEGRVDERTTDLRLANRELKREISERERSNDQLQDEMAERRQVEEALRKNEVRLRASQQGLNSIMNSVVDAVFTIDGMGFIQSFNHAAERIFKYSLIESLGKHVAVLIPELEPGQNDDRLFRHLQNEKANLIVSRELTALRKDGTSFPLETVITVMDGVKKRMFVAVGRDISQRKRSEAERAELERELSQAQKMEALGTLSGGIAHEINTPVQYVGDNIGFLKDAFSGLAAVIQKHHGLMEAATADGVVTEAVAEAAAAAEAADLDYLIEEVPSAIDQSIEGIERIGEIVRAIKEFSHPGAKEKSAVDVNRAIATTIIVSRNQWKYVAELETDFDASLPPISCLPGEFNQVILNLIVNAAHAVEEAGDTAMGRIVVATHQVDGWAEIRVSDTGCGIPKENHEKIFDPFFTTKEPGKGTGQGLALCHTIITKKHGGTIWLDSQVGKGTTFTIRLPLADPG